MHKKQSRHKRGDTGQKQTQSPVDGYGNSEIRVYQKSSRQVSRNLLICTRGWLIIMNKSLRK